MKLTLEVEARVCLLVWHVSATEASLDDSREGKGLAPRQTKLLSYCLVSTIMVGHISEILWPHKWTVKGCDFEWRVMRACVSHSSFFPSWLKPSLKLIRSRAPTQHQAFPKIYMAWEVASFILKNKFIYLIIHSPVRESVCSRGTTENLNFSVLTCKFSASYLAMPWAREMAYLRRSFWFLKWQTGPASWVFFLLSHFVILE